MAARTSAPLKKLLMNMIIAIANKYSLVIERHLFMGRRALESETKSHRLLANLLGERAVGVEGIKDFM